MEAAQRYLEAKERYPAGSEEWAEATARTFNSLGQNECAEVATPEWWNDEGLKALSARVVRTAPNDASNQMRAVVLGGQCDSWEARDLARQRSSRRRLRAGGRRQRCAMLRWEKEISPVWRHYIAARPRPCEA